MIGYQEAFATQILKARNDSKLTREQLANALELSREEIKDYELGLKSPTIEFLYKISKILNKDMNDFLEKSLDSSLEMDTRNNGRIGDNWSEEDKEEFRNMVRASLGY